MTDAQLGIYLANMQEPQSLEYNNPASMFFPPSSGVSVERLAKAVKETAAEEKPKRSRKKKAEAAEAAPAVTETAAEEKPKRSRKKKTDAKPDEA